MYSLPIKLLPSENLVYKTKLTKEQALQKLYDHVETNKSFGSDLGNKATSKPYIGNVTDDKFTIIRAIDYRNSFLPQITGEIYTEIDGTKIKVNMKTHPFLSIFMTIWFCVIFIICLATIFSSFNSNFSPLFLIPFAILFAGIAVLYGGFKIESSKSKDDLSKMFDAELEC